VSGDRLTGLSSGGLPGAVLERRYSLDIGSGANGVVTVYTPWFFGTQYATYTVEVVLGNDLDVDLTGTALTITVVDPANLDELATTAAEVAWAINNVLGGG
jgi:hypothetical protein